MTIGKLPTLRKLTAGVELAAIEQHDFTHGTTADASGLDAHLAAARRAVRRAGGDRAAPRRIELRRLQRSAPRRSARDPGYTARNRWPGLPLDAGRREAPRRSRGNRARPDRRADQGPHPRGAAFRRDRRDGRMSWPVAARWLSPSSPPAASCWPPSPQLRWMSGWRRGRARPRGAPSAPVEYERCCARGSARALRTGLAACRSQRTRLLGATVRVVRELDGR